MKKEKEPNFISKMWNEKKGRALIKLILWSLFIVIVGISLINSNPQIEKKEEIKEENEQNKMEQKIISIEEQFQNLITKDYQYEYKITTLESNETQLYKGEKVENIETGYKESKIGIIKYKIENEKTYQIFLDSQEEIESVFEESDREIITLQNLNEKLKTSEKIEEINGTESISIYNNSNETITLKSLNNKINTIKIITMNKMYELNFTYE